MASRPPSIRRRYLETSLELCARRSCAHADRRPFADVSDEANYRPMSSLALTLCIFAAAVLYSSVGHGGASGYLAAMALFSVAPESMRPAALVLNILVAAIGTTKFYRAGCLSWSKFWPFAVTSVPLAFVGGWLTLPSRAYKIVVG